jgi:serine/threonine protein kinase
MICPACQGDNREGERSCYRCALPLSGLLRRGQVLAARYEIQAPLGRGGMGTVFKAKDRVTGQTVAAKVLSADWASRPGMRERFRAEMRLAQKVSHRNVCRVLDCGEDGELRYIVTELVDGTDLKRLLRSSGALPSDRAFDAAIQMARGLQAVHEAGIVHRDIKSGNIMVDRAWRFRLLDFDLAVGVEAPAVPGSVFGTPEYMSPEQARGEKVDFRSDIYSLGIVIYEAFTGDVPFRGNTSVATIRMQLEEPPPLEGSRAAAVPAALLPVLRRALAKDPEARYSKARGLATALRVARSASGLEEETFAADAADGRTALLGALNARDATLRLETPTPHAAQSAAEHASILVLIAALTASSPEVRRQAARSLGRLGAAARDALTRALTSADPIVRRRAARILAQLRI